MRTSNASARVAGADNSRRPITPRGLVIRQPGEWIVRYWMKAESFAANCPFASAGGMQRVRWGLSDGRQGIAPADQEGKDFICTSPAGTFGWTQFRSDHDRNGQLVPLQHRLIITAGQPREVTL